MKSSHLNHLNSNYLASIKQIQKKVFLVLLMLIVYRVGCYIPLPGIDAKVLESLFQKNQAGLLGMFDMISGGSLGRMTIFALAIMPYITASIIMQLLSVVVKDLETLKKDGEAGRRKISQYTRYLTILLCIVQSYGISVALENMSTELGSLVLIPGPLFKIITMTSLTAGTIFLMWLADRISLQNIGNGTSLLIFSGIISGLPNGIFNLFNLGKTGAVSGLSIIFIIAFAALLLTVVVCFERSSRKLFVQYPKRQVGNRVYGGQSSFLPLKLNPAGVIPPIFASSLLLFPLTIVNFSNKQFESEWLNWLITNLAHGRLLYIVLYTLLIVFFCFFYSTITINPQETADNLKKNGAIIPGKKPGEATAKYIEYIVNRITAVGAVYLVLVCLFPEILVSNFSIPFYLGGTSILIVVNVIMDGFTQIQTHLFVGQYHSLVKKHENKKR
ncbi:preprotein translocase subunit SecY [Rickettsiales endosymbiont of Stachyamoeba lipophora]|uniref:preprotein translocase subunit SecY n=1 Tax=Rickettsiales endosymbiont of Stachyamoeba lipophora TaxID=2486578 RepID=UPI000F649619|nr:preprotein translocase subunit SecY [Rickettsiales endosymbiont of Stachyamoeba lipophora]AZL15884.1 preprotein translocase subunit SecY [Rickettsiales endosymbiont of Stachyamoeba lipophora]